MFGLPKTATQPFCPSEVVGCVTIAATDPTWKKMLRFAGPGLLISVGYMDPGNWATDIQAGSQYGQAMLFVVVLSSLAAMVLQGLSLRVGIVTGLDLAQLSRRHHPVAVARFLWALAEFSIIACDLAEVLGGALAFHLLLGVSLPAGVGLTALDTVIVLGFKGKGFRTVEAVILGLVATIGGCFLVELLLMAPDWHAVGAGLIPSLATLSSQDPLYLAIGILGATVMPHNLYLHSSITHTRAMDDKRQALRFAGADNIVSLSLALLVNAAILIMAGTAFHTTGNTNVTDIGQAYHLLDPIAGTAVAGLLFGLALLASGQSSTFTGTIAGQVILEGFWELKIPCYQRRLITRGLALIPALTGVIILGDSGVGTLLIASQVVLSLQLPFAMYPLIRFCRNRALMGDLALGTPMAVLAWALFVVITAANMALVGMCF